MRASRSVKLFSVLLLVLAIFSCAPKGLTPEAQKVFVAISIVDGLQALQSAAIDANKLQLVSDADSVQIVKYTRAAGIAVSQAPDGWRATVISGWDELQKTIPMDRVSKSQTLRILWVSFGAVVQQLKGVV